MPVKKLAYIVEPPRPHFVGDGFRVHNFIPGTPELSMEKMDPFILMDYNSKYRFPASDHPRGVDVHPHRGFETVTIAYRGKIEHHDSSGGGGVITNGGVQWMTAASGVLHKEFHETEWSKTGGDFQMVQLWLNLPAKHKMDPPKYQAINQEDMTGVNLNDAGKIELIAGNYKDQTGPADTFSPVHMMNAKLKSGGTAEFEFPANFNTIVLMIEGEAEINDQHQIPVDHLAAFSNEGDKFTLKANEDCIALVLSGKPLKEPIAAQGPFVMNTHEEIRQAMKDFQQGKFGELN